MAAALEAAKELEQATSELDMIRSLTPTLLTLQTAPPVPPLPTDATASVPDPSMDTSDKSAARTRPEDTGDSEKDRQTKWPKPASKGNHQGRGKGQSQNSSKWENWSNWKDSNKNKGDLDQLKQQVDMLTTLVLRQEHQLMINRQDTTYIIFIRTDVTPSLAVTSYNIGQSWKQAKTSNPESLKHPLRVILFQHLMTSMTLALENLLSDPQKVEQAKTLGWIQGEHFTGMKWNAEKKVHETDPNIPPIPIPQTLNLILEAIKLCTEPFAINRYHAMRPLASEYSSPTLTMMLEIGLRTAEANRLWSIFNNIAQTSVWLAVGAYCRHERLQRSALANRLAQGTSN